MKKRFVFCFLILISILLSNLAPAATYYVSPSGSDTIGNGSYNSPWRTFTKANSLMIGGDTLIYKNGIYNYSGSSISSPPSGTVSKYTMVKAETDGAAILEGYGIGINSRSYIKIEGFFCKDGTIDVGESTYIEFRRVSARSNPDGDGSVAGLGNGASYCLFEDCWFWGHGRYVLLFYGAYGTANHHNTARRVVVRWDGTDTDIQESSGISCYGSTDNTFENCIVIDFNPTTKSPLGGFRNREYGSARNKWLGCIALKTGNFAPFDLGGYATGVDLTLKNCVAIADSYSHAMAIHYNADSTLESCTFLNTAGSAVLNEGGGVITNSLFKNNGGAGGGTSFCHFDNSGSVQGTNATSGASGLLYPLRIEDGSACDGTGNGGVDRGANIIYQYVDGVLTTDNLWPWPYEDRIKAEMSEAFNLPSGSVPTTTNTRRGFCADGNGLYGGPITLTSYIWEYLGNACPADLCNYNIQYHSADTNQNSIVEMKELIAFIGLWKQGSANVNDVMTALDRWMRGN